MITTGNWRHELKYQISAADEAAICQRLFPVMKPDPHTGPDGRYQIRSIYFDNADDKALLEKINGLQKREKFRIRYYNDDFSFITLEKKINFFARGPTTKKSTTNASVPIIGSSPSAAPNTIFFIPPTFRATL